MIIFSKIKRKNLILLAIITFSVLLRLFWLHSAIERDEGIFAYIGWRMNEGEGLYSDLKDTKTPMIYVTYALSTMFFGNSIIAARLINNLLFFVSLFFMYKIGKIYFSTEPALYTVALYSVFMNLPVFEGALAMSESFANFFLILSFYLFAISEKENKPSRFIFSLLSAIISVLYNPLSIFFLFYLVMSVIMFQKKMFRWLLGFFLTIIILPFPYYSHLLRISKQYLSILNIYINLQMTNYVPFYYLKLILFEGALIWFFLIFGIIFVSKTRNFQKIMLMLLTLFISVIIPPSFGHYWIRLSIPVSLLSGYGAFKLTRCSGKSVSTILLLFLFTTTFFSTAFFVSKHYPTFNINYGEYKWTYSGEIESYDKQIEIAEFIKNSTPPGAEIGIWGWEGAVWYLSERTYANKPGIIWTCYEDILKNPSDYEQLFNEEKQKTLEELETKLMGKNPEKVRGYLVFNHYKRECGGYGGDVINKIVENWNKKNFGEVDFYYR